MDKTNDSHTDKPWKKVSSKLIAKNPWYQLHQDQVIRPDGKPAVYNVIKTIGGIGVVAINENLELYLVTQYRYATNSYSLEIPKGGFDSMNSSDSPLKTAKRELQEETGLTAETWTKLTTVHTLGGYSDDTVHLFLATDLNTGTKNRDGSEADMHALIVPLKQIDHIIKHGYKLKDIQYLMTDATSIAAIMLAKQRIHGKNLNPLRQTTP
jgi:8-oxo-dGTP pyrophosphatase MutT (NUDIX family)